MKQTIGTGRNRTGMGAAPRRGGRQEENAWKAVAAPPGDGQELARVRADYEREAGTVGTMAPPSSLKGAFKTVVQAGTGRNPAAFLDKLGERLAYERTGTRLYDLLIGKLESAPSPAGPASAGTLRAFREQEAAHFRMLWECLEGLGADPAVETPCADLAGVKAKGLVQMLSDPRTTLSQALDAMLIAELGDNEGWRLLIEMAQGDGAGRVGGPVPGRPLRGGRPPRDAPQVVARAQPGRSGRGGGSAGAVPFLTSRGRQPGSAHRAGRSAILQTG